MAGKRHWGFSYDSNSREGRKPGKNVWRVNTETLEKEKIELTNYKKGNWLAFL